MTVTVAKAELVEILTRNRASHVAEFEHARGVWREKMKTAVQKHVEELTAYLKTELVEVAFEKIKPYPQPQISELPRPVSFAQSYDRALGMLKLHVKEEMTIDMDTYRQYVEDDWDWKSQALISNSRYTS